MFDDLIKKKDGDKNYIGKFLVRIMCINCGKDDFLESRNAAHGEPDEKGKIYEIQHLMHCHYCGCEFTVFIATRKWEGEKK